MCFLTMEPVLHKQVLIINNDASLRDALTILLQTKEFQVVSCSMDHWRRKLEMHRPDLAIVTFPFSWYYHQIRKIITAIKERGNSKIPVLLLSTDKRVKDLAKAAGGNDFVEEPFDIAVFLDKVTSVFSKV